MQRATLTDDELWRAITQNTDELSALLRHLDEDVRVGIASTNLVPSLAPTLEAVNKFECEYQECIAELRRRHHCPEGSVGLNRERKSFRIYPRSIKTILARLVRGVTAATLVQYGLVAALISVIIVGAFGLRVH
jgi:hypothetical protein